MANGIDARAFRAELKRLDPAARRARLRAFRLWVRQSGRATGWLNYAGLVIAAIALLVLIIALALVPHLRWVRLLAILLFAACTGLNLHATRTSGAWRRAHPFEPAP